MAEIKNDEICESALNGTATFNHLLEATEKHFEVQLDRNYITKADFAGVYVQAVREAMAQAVQLELNRQQADAQAELLKAQAIQVKEETKNAEKNGRLIEQEILKSVAQTTLLDRQANNELKRGLILDKELLKMDAQITNLGFQNTLIQEQIIGMQKDNLIKEKQLELMAKQIEQISEEILIAKENLALMRQKVKESIADVAIKEKKVIMMDDEILKMRAEASLLNQKVLSAVEEIKLVKAQVNKASAESNLITQKTATEKAQTKEADVDDNSVIGKQKQLYGKQSDGFDHKAKNDVVKNMVDIANIAASNDPDQIRPGWIIGYEATNLYRSIKEAAQSAGLTTEFNHATLWDDNPDDAKDASPITSADGPGTPSDGTAPSKPSAPTP